MRIRIPNIFTDPDQDLALIPSPSHLIAHCTMCTVHMCMVPPPLPLDKVVKWPE